MTLKESTLASLDNSIAELKNSIANISDTKIKKQLEKTLRNLIKAREKMNPARHFSVIYILFIPVVFIFVCFSIGYFLRADSTE